MSKKAANLHAGPNMTPMVDIVMCILIFFMLAMDFAVTDLFLTNNSPAIEGQGISNEAVTGKPPAVQQKIELRREGGPEGKMRAYAFGQVVEDLSDKPSSSTLTLGQLLQAKRRELSNDVQLIIAPDQNVSCQDVMTVYDQCVRAKYENVAFTVAK